MDGSNPPSEKVVALAAVVPASTQWLEPFVRRCTLKPVSLSLLSRQVRSILELETVVAVRPVGPGSVVGIFEWVKIRMRRFPTSAMRRLPAPSTARPPGEARRASAAGPPSPLKPYSPVPAIVVRVPEESTRRIRLFRLSAMKRLPAPSTTTPSGRCNCTATAGPWSPLKPGSPVPATVVMVPERSTRRMRWFPESAMKMFPVVSTATPAGLCSCAARAGPWSPLKPRSPVPATVVMVPERSTRRMRWFPKSAMKRLPEPSTATPSPRGVPNFVPGA